MERKLNLRSVIKHLYLLFVGFGVCLIFIYIQSIRYGLEVEFIYFITVLYIVTIFLPILILFFNYYYINKGTSVLIDDKKISIISKAEKIEFKINEIEKIVQFMTPNKEHARTLFLHWGHYSYAKIMLKDKRQFIITSLIISDLRTVINSNLIQVKNAFYPLYWKVFD